MLPEFIIKSDGSWFGLSVYIERITQRSSMQPARWGKSSDHLDAALAPRPGRNGEGMSLPFLRSPGRPTAGGAWPAYRSRAGLGSNVSTCDGPPFMNRKMTRLARAGKCGGLGASGLLGNRTSRTGPRQPSSAATKHPGIGQNAGQSQCAEAAADPAEQGAPGHRGWAKAVCLSRIDFRGLADHRSVPWPVISLVRFHWSPRIINRQT